MKKLLVGCLIILVILAVGLGVATFVLYRAASPAIENARAYLSGLSELGEIDRKLTNQSPYEPPATGELTAAQVERFARVQDSMRQALGRRMDEIDAKYKNLSTDSGRQPSFGELMGALRDLADVVVQAKRFQVEALNQENFSLDEYTWVRGRVYQAAGVEAVGNLDLERVAAAVRDGTGIDSVDAPSLPEVNVNVPEANRAIVKPYLPRMDDWIPLAFFGL